MTGQGILCLRENIFEVSGCNQSQRHVAINSTEGQIIDRAAERRNVGSLRGIEFDRQNVFAIPVDMLRQLKGEWRITAFVFTQPLAVEPDGWGRHRAGKINEHSKSARFVRQLETAPV